MGVAWNMIGGPALFGATITAALGVALYALAPSRPANRRLALALGVDAILIGSGPGLVFFMTDPRDAFAWQGVFITAVLAAPVFYLLFLATLDSPATRWLRPRPVQAAVVLAGLAAEVFWLTHTPLFVPGVEPTWYAPWDAVIGDGVVAAFAVAGIVSFYAVVAAITAHRAAPRGSAARGRARAYAIAFVVRDVATGTGFFVLPFFLPLPPSGAWTDLLYLWILPVAYTLFALLLGYGVVKVQLFDIDLRIKRGLSRGVVAAAFLAVFLVGTEIAQNYVQGYGPLAGGVAAGLLLFALRPLEAMASRVADAAMPGVRPSPEYMAFRKLQVYRAAVEAAAAHEGISVKERSILERLRAELGILPEDARAIESETVPPAANGT